MIHFAADIYNDVLTFIIGTAYITFFLRILRKLLEIVLDEILKWIQMLSVVIAALFLGRWFDQERKKSEAAGDPWYTPWRSVPGILIIVVICFFLVLKKLTG